MPFPLDDQNYIREHFRKKGLSWTEEHLIGVLENPQSSKWDVYYAVLALRDCGTMCSLDALKAVLRYPMQDVKCTSVLTIAHIARESETPLYANLLLDTTYREKAYAMWAILDAADERAIDAVLEYFKRNRKKLLRGELANGTVPKGLEYLEKFIDRDLRIGELFGDVLQSLPKLSDKDEIREQVKFFEDSGHTARAHRALHHVARAILRALKKSANPTDS